MTHMVSLKPRTPGMFHRRTLLMLQFAGEGGAAGCGLAPVDWLSKVQHPLWCGLLVGLLGCCCMVLTVNRTASRPDLRHHCYSIESCWVLPVASSSSQHQRWIVLICHCGLLEALSWLFSLVLLGGVSRLKVGQARGVLGHQIHL